MKSELIQRIKEWLCKKLGHRQGKVWIFKGANSTCKRCGQVYKLTFENAMKITPKDLHETDYPTSINPDMR